MNKIKNKMKRKIKKNNTLEDSVKLIEKVAKRDARELFLNCCLAAPRRNSGQCQGESLTYPMLIGS